MKKKSTTLLVTGLLTAALCLLSAALLPKTVAAEEKSAAGSYGFYNDVSKTDYDGVHYSSFDALSVNLPSTSSTGLVTVKFPFAATDMTDENAAVRMRIQTVVPVKGRESLRFDLVGSSVMNMMGGATVYREQKGTASSSAVQGLTGAGAHVYVIDTAEVNGTKTFDGYVILPVSVWSSSATGITGINVRTNPLYSKTIWNFGDIEYGTVTAKGAFAAGKTLWSAYDANGNANPYTVDASVDAALVKANTMEGAAKSFYLKTQWNASAAANAAYSTSGYDGIQVRVDNTGSAARSFQFYVWDAATDHLGTPSYGWLTKNGLAYFMPDEDCAAFKNASAYRSSFIPAGFKGEMYVPFTVNSESESGAWQANTNAGKTFPTAICNQVFVYVTNTAAPFGLETPALAADGAQWTARAFAATASVNLAIDDAEALMIQQRENTVSMQYELQPKSEGNVPFSAVNTDNEVITGGAALAVSVENLNGEPFRLQVTTYNSRNDRVVLGGSVASARVKFTHADGKTELLDFADGYAAIPAFARGTLTLSYVGGTPAALSDCTYALGYPYGNIFRIYFSTVKSSGTVFPVEYLVGDLAVVHGDGTPAVLTINGTSAVCLAATDASYRIERTNVGYSGLLKYSTAGYTAHGGAAIAVDKTLVRWNGEVTYTINGLSAANGLVSATLNGVDVTQSLAEKDGTYTFTTRIKEDCVLAISTFLDTLDINDGNFYYEGASIRLKKAGDTTGDGIRFSMVMTKELYDKISANASVSPVFGTLLIPADMKNGPLTKDTPYVSNTRTNDILTATTIENKEYIRWTIYLWNIPRLSLSRGFCARGYIDIGGVYFYTAEKQARSISWVVQQAYADPAVSDSVKDLCGQYLPEVTFDLNGAAGSVESLVLYDAVTYTLPAFETLGIKAPEGKTLVGYRVYGNTYNVGDKLIINGNVTVTLVWEGNGNEKYV